MKNKNYEISIIAIIKLIFSGLHDLSCAIWIFIRLLFKNFNLLKIFNFFNILKLATIYCTIIVWVIITDFNFSNRFFVKLLTGTLSNNRLSVYSVSNRIGEGLLYYRMLKILRDKGIDYSATRFSEDLSHFWFTEHFYYVASSVINYLFKPDFNLALTHYVNIVPYGYNVMYLNMPTNDLYGVGGSFKLKYGHLKKYQAYADLYTLEHGKNPSLDRAILTDKLEGKKIIPVYFAQNYVEYKDPTIKKAIISGSLWGCNRGSQRVAHALKRLVKDDLLDAYGLEDELAFLGEGYKGKFEKFGPPINSIIKIQNSYGIALIIHNLEHLLDGVPTSRISEAAASCALIIADRHPFIEKYFGENALYFNAFGSEEEIYQQIKAHILWAQNNKSEALTKIQNAYNVFVKNFTMETQIDFLMKEVFSHK